MSSIDPIYAYKIGMDNAQRYSTLKERVAYMITWMIVWAICIPMPIALMGGIGVLIIWVNR